jgi:glycosyltransferase involved in cell wall biosynthesis
VNFIRYINQLRDSLKKPLVTVAIPTYQRPQLLKRALDSLLEQDYENFEVLISDNGTEGDTVENVVSEYKNRFLNLTFYKQKQNIGALKNFFFLLDRAKGDYFMWLADDDEISLGYISDLSEMLNQNPDAATVSANWLLKRDMSSEVMMPRKEYDENFWFFRATKFIINGNDDFFYGMHRRKLLINAKFDGYFWPNKKELMNWAYVFLLDQIIAGKVLVTNNEKIIFINHSYTQKKYVIEKNYLITTSKMCVRRINLHILYFIKMIKNANYSLIIPIIIFILIMLSIEILIIFMKAIIKSLKYISNSVISKT